MNKKLLYGALSSILAVGMLAACGDDAEEPADENGTDDVEVDGDDDMDTEDDLDIDEEPMDEEETWTWTKMKIWMQTLMQMQTWMMKTKTLTRKCHKKAAYR